MMTSHRWGSPALLKYPVRCDYYNYQYHTSTVQYLPVPDGFWPSRAADRTCRTRFSLPTRSDHADSFAHTEIGIHFERGLLLAVHKCISVIIHPSIPHHCQARSNPKPPGCRAVQSISVIHCPPTRPAPAVPP